MQVQSFACRGDGARVGGFSGARLSWCRTLHVSMAKRRGLVYGFPPSLPGQTQRRPISRVSGVKLFYRLFIHSLSKVGGMWAAEVPIVVQVGGTWAAEVRSSQASSRESQKAKRKRWSSARKGKQRNQQKGGQDRNQQKGGQALQQPRRA